MAGEFRRGVEVARLAVAAGADQFGGEGVEMRLVAGRDLERRRLDLDEALGLEPAPQRRGDPVPPEQERPAVAGGGLFDQKGDGVVMRKAGWRDGAARKALAVGGKLAKLRANWKGPPPAPQKLEENSS